MRRSCRAGMTLEAAVMISLLLFVMIAIIDLGIDLYQEVSVQKEQEVLEGLWMVDPFYLLQNGKETIDSLIHH